MSEDSLAHTKWNCKYHIVFAPKYRRQVRKPQVPLQKQAVLVPWLLCRHGRKEQGGDRKVHSEPAGGGQNVRAAGDEGAFRPIHRGAHNKEMK